MISVVCHRHEVAVMLQKLTNSEKQDSNNLHTSKYNLIVLIKMILLHHKCTAFCKVVQKAKYYFWTQFHNTFLLLCFIYTFARILIYYARVHKKGPRTLQRLGKQERLIYTSLCVLQPSEIVQERIKCCSIGKIGLYKVLATGGSIRVNNKSVFLLKEKLDFLSFLLCHYIVHNKKIFILRLYTHLQQECQ